MKGLILAGGKATRLGPLAAQMNKSLVSVGGKPQLVRQVQQLKEAGCESVHVVVSRGAVEQVQSVIERAGIDCEVIVQNRANGPGGAIASAPHVLTGEAIVIMSDTILAQEHIPWYNHAVCVADAPTTRPWCYFSTELDEWRDDVAPAGSSVAIGCYRVHGPAFFYAAVDSPEVGGEVGMADVLNKYEWKQEKTLRLHSPSWVDVGDVPALAKASTQGFISRAHHSHTSPAPGKVTKHGIFPRIRGEAQRINEAPNCARHLFPTVYESNSDSYTMERIDLPSLAELWNYWPSRPEMWTHIGEELLDQLSEHLWRVDYGDADITGAAGAVYLDKIEQRYVGYPSTPAPHYKTHVSFNGDHVLTGSDLLEAYYDLAEKHLVNRATPGTIHGDPNFTNVLWSLKTGSFKLIDPLPWWGGLQRGRGDVRYDIGKIAYSPDFSAITHGLFSLRESESIPGRYYGRILPDRQEEVLALQKVIERHVSNIEMQLLRAHCLLASAPLHEPHEANMLYLLAADAITELSRA